MFSITFAAAQLSSCLKVKRSQKKGKDFSNPFIDKQYHIQFGWMLWWIKCWGFHLIKSKREKWPYAPICQKYSPLVIIKKSPSGANVLTKLHPSSPQLVSRLYHSTHSRSVEELNGFKSSRRSLWSTIDYIVLRLLFWFETTLDPHLIFVINFTQRALKDGETQKILNQLWSAKLTGSIST